MYDYFNMSGYDPFYDIFRKRKKCQLGKVDSLSASRGCGENRLLRDPVMNWRES